jgi:tetratricopeptide (TPR) repeat protein
MEVETKSARRGSIFHRWPTQLDASAVAAIFTLVLLAGSFAWWALKFGAYFGTVMYPGMAILGIGAAVLTRWAPWPASLALSRPVRVAAGALVSLSAWSLLSALWSPTPDIAVEDAQRIAGYAIAFGLGTWSCVLLGRRMELAMLPVAAAGGLVALVTLVVLALASGPDPFLDEDGTLQWPLGYRNANAAFFLIAFWPAICLASSARVPPGLRLAAFVSATACFELGVLCQSRGAIAGFIVGGIAVFAASPTRLNLLSRLLAIAPAAPAFFAASALFEAAQADPSLATTVGELNTAGRWGLLSLLASAVIGYFVVRFDQGPAETSGTSRTRTRLWTAGIATTSVVVLVALLGNPATWAGDRIDEFLAGEPDLTEESDRFTFNAGSNRSEVWRVAIDAAAEDPVFGEGGGGFQFRYNRERDDPRQLARDAHSVWLEMLSELGVVGLVLFAAFVAGALLAIARARSLGPAAAQLSAAALGASAYWLTHSSVDWFWPYPGVTAPALALMGAAIAPALLVPGRRGPTRGRGVLAALLFAFVLSLLPPLLSERLVERSLDTFRVETERAYADLDLARTLNPLSDTPALTEGSIALELNDRRRAVDAFEEATRERPEEYAGHFFLALLYAESDPDRARRELAVVRELNPLDARIPELEEQIEASERRAQR